MSDDRIQVLPPGLARLVEAVLIMAHEGKTTTGTLARRLGLGQRYFEPHVRFLAKSGIIVSKTGPGGGLWLAKPTAEISVGALARVCAAALEKANRRDCRVESQQRSVLRGLQLMRSRMIGEMDAVTIADLQWEIADLQWERWESFVA